MIINIYERKLKYSESIVKKCSSFVKSVLRFILELLDYFKNRNVH